MITAFGTTETAVEAIKMGATDYVLKPFKIDELQTRIQKALDYQAAVRENTYLRKELKNRYRFENIIGTSRKMQHENASRTNEIWFGCDCGVLFYRV